LQTKVAGVSVAQVARRYAMNANLIRKWLRDPRFAPEPDIGGDEAPEFLAVEIEGAANECVPQAASTAPDGGLSAQRVDITLSDGRRILVEGTAALPAVLALFEGLMP
jgi:transposase